MTKVIDNLENYISGAVAHYWQTRKSQREKQKNKGVSDAGLRSAVTGGAQMDGFIHLFTEIIVEAGMNERYVFRKRLLELPGFFRSTKEWDLLVVKNGYLVAAIEAKSQVGPSFGNTSIIEQKKQWAALLIFGRLIGRVRSMVEFSPFSDIFSCLRIVMLQFVQ